MTARNTTFKEAYDTLQRHAETLRNQREPDLDNLLTIVTESVGAFQVCKARIDAVEKALEEALSGAGVDGDAGAPPATDEADFAPAEDAAPARRAGANRGAAPLDPDDDIPF
ncbi:MAG: hypothetical protein MZW92_74545 [Comamonadaceae bacterium]|nr:hypothetical protein [Comamonadaceae bacterium]